VTGEGFIDVFHDPQLHDYIIDFAKSNLSGEDRQARFVKDVWCDVGQLAHGEPSLHLIAEVVWRRMIQYEPTLARLADGYTTRQIARMEGISHQAVSKRKKRIVRGCQNTPPSPVR
jgi:DNA-binding CsgD family transcriptional regulator